MRRLVLVLGVSMALAACQTSFDEMSPEEKNALIQQKGDDCKAFGYKPGTTDFAKCIQTSVIERDRKISQQQAAAAASRPRYCNDYGGSIVCF